MKKKEHCDESENIPDAVTHPIHSIAEAVGVGHLAGRVAVRPLTEDAAIQGIDVVPDSKHQHLKNKIVPKIITPK